MSSGLEGKNSSRTGRGVKSMNVGTSCRSRELAKGIGDEEGERIRIPLTRENLNRIADQSTGGSGQNIDIGSVVDTDKTRHREFTVEGLEQQERIEGQARQWLRALEDGALGLSDSVEILEIGRR